MTPTQTRSRKKKGAEKTTDENTRTRENNQNEQEPIEIMEIEMETAPRVTKTNFKTVDHNSINRRTLHRQQENRDRTPEANNRNNFANKTRMTLRLKLPATNNPTTTLSNVTRQVLQKLLEQDDTIGLLPWKGNRSLEPNIKTVNRVPRDISSLRIYLERFYYPENQERTIYPHIYLGHTKPVGEIIRGMAKWFESQGHGMYRDMVQDENVVGCGFLVFSTQQMDRGALADEMKAAFGYEIGLRWRPIDKGEKGTNKKNEIKAIHIECKYKEKRQVLVKLKAMYGTKLQERNNYPNCLRFRYVGEITECINQRERGKVKRLIMKQGKFLSSIVTRELDEVTAIDYNPTAEQPTMRQMIMSINSLQQEKPTPLFLNVDLNWKGDTHMIQFARTHQPEAECMLLTLYPFLEAQYPNAKVRELFNSDAIDRCQGYVYDEEKKMVVDTTTQDDENEDDDDELLGFTLDLTEATLEDQLRPSERPRLPYDDDSVSTLGGPTKKPRRAYHNSTNSASSNNSGITMDTSHTISTLRSEVTSLREELKDELKKIAADNQSLIRELLQGNGSSRRDDDPHELNSSAGGNTGRRS